ncbi:MAG: preprotein translocase subunit SecY [Candidatus Electryoneaceae bacterium]|nr:preprotein translocase subunit SecY [Candidatus Electryoneaceae bacterium]
MFQQIQNIFKIPELKRRILFTLLVFIVYRIGGHVPVPGINASALGEFLSAQQNTLFGLYDMFAGGNFRRATVFALGIMPYISASIILQLMGMVSPALQKLQQSGDEGRKKINQWTRYLTVVVAAMQASGTAAFLSSLPAAQSGLPVIPNPGIPFVLMTMLTMTTGCIFVMWLGEQITDRGIGNGISLLIFIGIIDRLPYAFLDEIQLLKQGIRQPIAEVFMLALAFFTIVAVVALTQGMRKISVQYAKRVVGRKVYGGQSTHIPLRINTAGVMPIIFAQTIMFFPSTLATFVPPGGFQEWLTTAFSMDSYLYMFFYMLLIIFFTYFYTAVAFNPVEVANNLKKHGGLIPSVKPGKKTAEYLNNILTKITLPGSIFLGFIAIFPTLITKFLNVSYSFASFYGGTGLLIIVGVSLDTLQQIESHLLMRHYDGLMKSGRKMRGRRRM